VRPLTRYVGAETLLAGPRNTIVFEADMHLRDTVFKLFATNHGPDGQAARLGDLMCCLPQVQAPDGLGYRDVFRVLVLAFMDATNFDVRAMKKSCVHIAQPDGTIIPFEAFNLFYRGERRALLETRRREVEAAYGLES